MTTTTPVRTETDKTALWGVCQTYGPIEVVYDCGARDALDGIEICQRLNSGELHTFECNPPSVEICRGNLSRHASDALRTHLCSHAVADCEGEIEFHPIDTSKTTTVHKDGNPGASSLFLASDSYTKEHYVQTTIKVPVTTLDIYCRSHRKPDLLWMDLQGAEVMALRGARETLPSIRVIHVEVSCRAMYENQAMFWDIHRELAPDFDLVHFDVGRWPRLPRLYRLLKWGPWLGNAIYVNRRAARA